MTHIYRHREEEDKYQVSFAGELETGETLTNIVSCEIRTSAGADVSDEFGLNTSPAPVIVDALDPDDGTTVTHASGGVDFWLRSAADSTVQTASSYRVYLEVETSLGRQLVALTAQKQLPLVVLVAG